jgi:hypothetical protein
MIAKKNRNALPPYQAICQLQVIATPEEEILKEDTLNTLLADTSSKENK